MWLWLWAAVASAQEFDWLVGHWQGAVAEDRWEEHWEPAWDGTLFGSFRAQVDGHVSFYELITLGPRDGRVMMRIKHFGPDLVGWESRKKAMDFELVEHEGNRAVFQLVKAQEWLVYERTGDALEIRLYEGSLQDEPMFAFQFTAR